MILSDVSQRRMLVDRIEEVERIEYIAERDNVIFSYKKIDEELYLIKLTNRKVGDYFTRNSIKYPGVASEEVNDIKKVIDKHFNSNILD